MRRLTHNPFFFFSLCLCAVLFCLMELWCIPFFAGIFILLYAVIPTLGFCSKRASAIRKIKRICKAKGYAFEVNKASRVEKHLTVKTEYETFCVTLLSFYHRFRSFVMVTAEDRVVLEDKKSGTAAFEGLGYGYTMRGTSVQKTTAYRFRSGSSMVKNFPACVKRTEIALQKHPAADAEGARRVLVVYPPVCETFMKQKDEVTLACNGMRAGNVEFHTLKSFCDMI